MPTTSTEVSRLKLLHPDLNHDGGAPLHGKVRTAWTSLGDNINARFATGNIASGGGVLDVEHNFKVDFDSQLTIVLYSYVTGTGESTIMTAGGTPDLNDFPIIAKVGEETTAIRITNNGGSNEDVSVLIVHSGGSAGGGGGGGGLVWNPVAGEAPIGEEEYGEQVYKYEAGLTQKLQVYLKVPDSYVLGKQVNMRLAHYSPSAANTVLLTATATLIQKDVDAITTTTNQQMSANTAVTNTVADQYREIVCDLSSASGQINSVAINGGDIIKVELERGTDTDTAEVRMVPSATEVTFS